MRIGNHDLGLVATINNEVRNNYGLKNEIVFVELNFVELLILFGNCKMLKYEAAPKYPAISRDLAFVVDSRMLYNDLRREIKSFNDLIIEVELFDSYQGGKLGEDQKSLAFHIVYQSLERTLRTEEIDAIQNNLISVLEEKFHAQIRNF